MASCSERLFADMATTNMGQYQQDCDPEMRFQGSRNGRRDTDESSCGKNSTNGYEWRDTFWKDGIKASKLQLHAKWSLA